MILKYRRAAVDITLLEATPSALGMNHVAHTTRLQSPDRTLRVPTMSFSPSASLSPSPSLVTARMPARPRCLNCEAVLVGKFCHGCGQAAKTPARISVSAILHELPHAILHLEHALPHTIFALLRRPGHAVREYLSGKRVKTYSPFTLLFLVAGLVGLALAAFGMNKTGIDFTVAKNDFAPKMMGLVFKHQGWIRLAFLPLLAVGPTLVLRGRTGIRYGEHIVAAAMITAGSSMLQLAWLPLEWFGGKLNLRLGGWLTILAELCTTLYVIWSYAQLQDDGRRRDGIRRWLRAVAALVVSSVVWMAGMIAAIVLLAAGYFVCHKLL